jgi:hypothetical protein
MVREEDHLVRILPPETIQVGLATRVRRGNIVTRERTRTAIVSSGEAANFLLAGTWRSGRCSIELPSIARVSPPAPYLQ